MNTNINKIRLSFLAYSIIYALFFYSFYESSWLCNLDRVIYSLSLCFIANISLMLLEYNPVIRTKFYLIITAIAIGLLYSLEYEIFSNLELRQIILIACFCAVLAIGPFRLLKSLAAEERHQILTIFSIYILFIGLRCQISFLSLYQLAAFIILLFNFLISIFRAKEINGISVAEIFLAFLLIMPLELSKKYLIPLLAINIIFALVAGERRSEFLKRIMRVIIGLTPAIISYGHIAGYGFTIYLLLLIIIAPKSGIISREILKSYAWMIVRLKRSRFHKPSLKMPIKIIERKEMSLSFAIALIFIILIIISTL